MVESKGMPVKRSIKPTPWPYFLVRLLFKILLKVFYGTIVVENEQFIPKNGMPCIICANHSNSLTDASLLVAAVSSKRRNFLRLTAKATLFGQRTFSSWLIESVGTVPIQRRKDYSNGIKIDNTEAMSKLVDALDEGDVVGIFPEGISRFQPSLAPLKSGAIRIASEVLTRNKDDPNFTLTIVPCSITYMHRQQFRSDVLVSFNRPLTLSAATHPLLLSYPKPVSQETVNDLTSFLSTQISAGMLDAPSWDTIQIAKTAARIYAPLGTGMRLGDWVRVVRAFIEGFGGASRVPRGRKWDNGSAEEPIVEEADEDQTDPEEYENAYRLAQELKGYQKHIDSLGLKDDRIRRRFYRPFLFVRILIRVTWLTILFALALPGLFLWVPIFITTRWASEKSKTSGPLSDVLDETAQVKVLYGLLAGVCVWLSCSLLTGPFFPIAALIIPIWMWMTLRWFEDGVSALRALISLFRLLTLPKDKLNETRRWRARLERGVNRMAVRRLGLPADPVKAFSVKGDSVDWKKEKGWVSGSWGRGIGYFSITRRRKRDWNETLRWYNYDENLP